jgi:flagellar motor switch protein FliN
VENISQAASLFLEAWSPELSKSIEMFTGTPVTIELGDAVKGDQFLASQDSVLWLKHTFESQGTGSAWIAAPGTTCSALTRAIAEDSDGREALMKELLLQSLAGAAHLLSAGRNQKILCKSGEDGSPPEVTRLQRIWLIRPDQERLPLFIGLDSNLLDLLRVNEPSLPQIAQTQKNRPTVIDQLLDLELPVAVVLGRTRLAIRDLIKLTAGSLVELDQRAGDLVEIVVHNAVVAKGEVVSIGGNYGVKIQEVISRRERIAIHRSVAPPALRGPVRPAIH